MMGMPSLAAEILAAKNPCIVVGGFPHGHFTKEVIDSVDQLVRIDVRPLEAHVVASRVVYEIEKAAAGIND